VVAGDEDASRAHLTWDDAKVTIVLSNVFADTIAAAGWQGDGSALVCVQTETRQAVAAFGGSCVEGYGHRFEDPERLGYVNVVIGGE
jgi:hypothetical protein